MEFKAKHGRFVFSLVLKSRLGRCRNLEGMGMLFALDEESEGESAVSYIPLVNKFLDVFPLEHLGLSPEREIEFCIDLILGTFPVSIALYLMA